MQKPSIRPAGAGDEETVVALLRGLADYERLLDRFRITPEVVRRDYFCERPLLHCDLLFEGSKPAGIATWQWSYGSFAAMPKIYLADLYVPPEYRGRRYGRALIAHLARRALEHGGAGVEWEVLDWNKPSIDFYDSLGARPVQGWIGYRLEGAALEAAAASA
ncbi:MAG: GNAT family N-acetyltransferase [Alphaproteobacteria bacterium]|nr:GNAT family N-acetyltransferase [Alphaproteobacteria bacterium]MBV9694302.1 GNAT family N-acetyltransferase [Alphaproteobacteria bacterium]